MRARNRRKQETSTVVIVTLTATDILLGRGVSISSRPGNCAFRRFVDSHRDSYVNGNRTEKKEIARKVIRDVELQDPPGRFVKSCGGGTFKVVTPERSYEKTAQALREKHVKNDRLSRRKPVTTTARRVNEAVTSAHRRPRLSRKKKTVAKKSQTRAPSKPDKIVSVAGVTGPGYGSAKTGPPVAVVSQVSHGSKEKIAKSKPKTISSVWGYQSPKHCAPSKPDNIVSVAGLSGPGYGSAKTGPPVAVASQVNHGSKEEIAKSKPKIIPSVWDYESPKHCRRTTHASKASGNEEKSAFASAKDHGGGANAYSNSLLHEALTQPLPFFDQIDQEFQTMRDTEMFAPKEPHNPTIHVLAATVKEQEPLEPLFGFGDFSDTGSLVFETMSDYSIENGGECVSDSFRDSGQCGDI